MNLQATKIHQLQKEFWTLKQQRKVASKVKNQLLAKLLNMPTVEFALRETSWMEVEDVKQISHISLCPRVKHRSIHSVHVLPTPPSFPFKDLYGDLMQGMGSQMKVCWGDLDPQGRKVDSYQSVQIHFTAKRERKDIHHHLSQQPVNNQINTAVQKLASLECLVGSNTLV